MNKLFLLLLLITSVTYAATPTYQVFPTWASQLDTGTTQILNFTVQRTGIVANVSNANLFSNYLITQHDTFRWTNTTHVIQLSNNVVLAPNEQFTFTQSGVYTFTSTTNNSLTGEITVNPIVFPSLTVTPNSPNSQFTMSNVVTKQLNDPITTFQITESHTNQLLAQSYPFNVLLSGALNITISQSVEFKPTYTSDVSYTISDNYTTESGKSLYLGSVNFTNTGNTDFTVSATATGNGSGFLTFPFSRVVFRNSKTGFPIQMDIPLATKSGVFETELVFDNGRGEKTPFPITITVKDITEPVVDQINLSDKIVIQPNQVVLTASDNLGLRSANFTINNKTISLTRDKNLFIGTYSVPELRQYLYTYCVDDIELNRLCDTGTLNPVQYVVDIPSTIEFLRHKSGTYKRKPFFTLNDTLPSGMNITYRQIQLEDNKTDVSVRVLRDGSVDHTLFVNDTITLFDKGNYTIEIRTDRTTEYELSFIVSYPKELSTTSSFRIIGETVAYDILDSEELLSALPDGVRCDVIDTGEFETSKYQCITDIPVGTDAESIGVFISRREKRLYDTQLNASQEQLSDQKSLTKFLSGGFVAILLLVLGFMIYMLQYHRYTYFMFGREK